MLTDEDLDAMLAKAGDGVDHEWGWYQDDVPRLVAELRRLPAERAYLRACYDRAIGELHTARAELADQIRQTEAALARVEALCDNHEAGIAAWKAANRRGFPLGEPGIPAGEVRAALAGDPPAVEDHYNYGGDL